MANTGIKNVLTLRKYVNGVATSEVKDNTIGDPDYIAPYEDLVACPIGAEPTTTSTTTTSTTVAPTTTTTTTTTASSFNFYEGTSLSFSTTLPDEDPKTRTISGIVQVIGSARTFKVTVYMPFNSGNIATGRLEVNGNEIEIQTTTAGSTATSTGTVTIQPGSYQYTVTGILDVTSPRTYGAIQVGVIEQI